MEEGVLVKRESVFYLICMLIIMAAIFGFSSQNRSNTNKTSDVIVKPIENTIKANSTKTFEDEKAENSYWKKINSKIDKAVRKSAHIFIYGVLGIFSLLFFRSIGLRWEDAIMLAILLSALYGVSDELHQGFINGRDARAEDICIDTFGAWVGTLIVYIFHKIKLLRLKNKEA